MMVDLVITDASRLDLRTLRCLRAALPAERRERSDRYERAVDRSSSIVVFAQLQHLWAERRGGPLPRIDVGRFGKPDFGADVGLHFNWSHDRALCACVLSPVPVGVDISGRVPFDPELFTYMAAPGEMALGEHLRALDDMSALWTRKEATVKRTGLGLHTPLREVDTTGRDDILTFSCGPQGFSISVNLAGIPARPASRSLRTRFLTPAGPQGWSVGPAPPLRRLDAELQAV
ncbi:4'-phosphopantetheinyl transferase superfamily protein [Arachnia propionica]|uniref:4'-phosphopantetheinyl transferase superfamily protein n=1 Tax=Arachnia propionica TaxID=1750 RepID=A0A3P1T470_9ACTN|nr:4'-phosphopantetheinyl transferase superfamily protein [Arachnia propionica]MDO5084143.1 4'-phosphopantetheinyl transferase superfamily protein [Arachnia propionica]RRD03606.1 4'-phosphopantetheinyl transferase superfamily protein [Arachnia propionica]